jgi:hypothetical protein
MYNITCSETTYLLQITTGDLPRADTEALIYCVLTGDQGDTGKIFLRHSKHGGLLFRRAQVMSFARQFNRIGIIRTVEQV